MSEGHQPKPAPPRGFSGLSRPPGPPPQGTAVVRPRASFEVTTSDALERIADALETIAKPRDQANLGMAMQLKAAEERAHARLLQLQAVKVIVEDGSISGLQMEERIRAFLGSVLP